jgi:chloramphenicol-sensitive protein RarD
VNPGIAYALSAFLIWGMLPLYLHLVAQVGSLEVLAHRVVWSLPTVAVLLVAARRLDWIVPALRAPRALLRYVATAALISANWMIYIWAVNNGHVIDSSLGYFINPLVNVVLGALFLGERMRNGQKLAVGIAAAGVGWLALLAGAPPWIGVGLALCFGFYGLLRKTASLGALEGFALESAILTPFALAYLAAIGLSGHLAFASDGLPTALLLVAAGPVTATPLLLFAAGARRISLSLLGVLQYIAPTIQWLCGIFFFREAFDAHMAIGYGLIWFALAVYGLEGVWFSRGQARAAAA